MVVFPSVRIYLIQSIHTGPEGKNLNFELRAHLAEDTLERGAGERRVPDAEDSKALLLRPHEEFVIIPFKYGDNVADVLAGDE